MKRITLRKDAYYDSVFLMLAAREIQAMPGVSQAVVTMATPMNVELLIDMGFDAATFATLSPNDLVVAIDAIDVKVLDHATAEALKALTRKKAAETQSGIGRVGSLDAALKLVPEANLAVISVPGTYAAREARKCLELGLHVMLFSDNVSLDDEIALKKLAVSKGLLLMGPDCGTAIVNGVPLGFANVVRRGPIGIVGASGTGIQEVTSLIDRYGGGVSQALGTGGRDLSRAVAARSTLAAIEALVADPETTVLVVVSKAPAPEVAERVLAKLADAGKPAVVHFVGTTGQAPRGRTAFAETLAETARGACRLAGVAVPENPEGDLPKAHFSTQKGSLRGFFCGGTLAQEAWAILRRRGIEVRSNVALDSALHVKPGDVVAGHVLWDLGDDAFTVGRPHPMIEPELRDAEVARAVMDPSVAVVLVDCVLGSGAHPDPAGSLAQAVEQGLGRGSTDCRAVAAVVASVTGTDRDPQNYRDQRRKLEAAGVVVAESNAQAASWVAASLRWAAGGEAAE